MKIFEDSRNSGKAIKNPISYKKHGGQFDKPYDEPVPDEPVPDSPSRRKVLFKSSSKKREISSIGNDFANKEGSMNFMQLNLPVNSMTPVKNLTIMRDMYSPARWSRYERLMTTPNPEKNNTRVDLTDARWSGYESLMTTPTRKKNNTRTDLTVKIIEGTISNVPAPIKPLNKDQLNFEYVTLQTHKKTVFNKLTKFIVNGIQEVPVDASIFFLRDAEKNAADNEQELAERDEFLEHDGTESV